MNKSIEFGEKPTADEKTKVEDEIIDHSLYSENGEKISLPCDSYAGLDIFGSDNMLRNAEIDDDLILNNLVPEENKNKCETSEGNSNSPTDLDVSKEEVPDDSYLIDNNSRNSPRTVSFSSLKNSIKHKNDRTPIKKLMKKRRQHHRLKFGNRLCLMNSV